MKNVSPKRIREFLLGTVDEYVNNHRLHDICKVNVINENDVTSEIIEDEYIHVGLKVELKSKMITESRGSTYFDPVIHGLGQSIANGEVRYFSELLHSQEGKRRTISVKKLSLTDLQQEIHSPSSIIISSEILYTILQDHSWYQHIDFDRKYKSLSGKFKWFTISSQFIGHNIFILDRNALNLNRLNHLESRHTNEYYPLKFEFADPPSLEVTIYSTIKFVINDDYPVTKIKLVDTPKVKKHYE